MWSLSEIKKETTRSLQMETLKEQYKKKNIEINDLIIKSIMTKNPISINKNELSCQGN